MIRAAIIGFGGIARTAHYPCYPILEKEGKATLTAICDISPEAFTSGAQINIGETALPAGGEARHYTDYREMLEKEKPDMVDICLPTYLHAEAVCAALEAGCHVLCEKPMSLSYAECTRIIRTARECGKELMIGQCLRFGAKYRYLKDAVENNTFGKIRSGVFRRMSPPPVWGWDNWYMDFSRSHGCITDMHIHDIDLIRYLCGEPLSVSCHTQDIYSHMDIAYSILQYRDAVMLAIADWTQTGLPFRTDYRVAFEEATVDYTDDVVTVYPRSGKPFSPDIGNDNFYENEIRFFVDRILSGGTKPETVNPPESAAETVRLIETLMQSAEAGGSPLPFAEEMS